MSKSIITRVRVSYPGECVLEQSDNAALLAVLYGVDTDACTLSDPVHLGRIGKGCQADLADVAARQPVLQQSADGIAV
jgi:hypothetical protein